MEQSAVINCRTMNAERRMTLSLVASVRKLSELGFIKGHYILENRPETWFTQFPNPDLYTSETYGVRQFTPADCSTNWRRRKIHKLFPGEGFFIVTGGHAKYPCCGPIEYELKLRALTLWWRQGDKWETQKKKPH